MKENENTKNELCAVSDYVSGTVKPKYVVNREDENWQVNVELPGSKKGDVDVSFEDGILEIKARRTDEVPESWRPLSYVERPGGYRLRLDLPDTVATDKIEARLEDGVLHLELPVSEAVKPRAITVS